MQSSALGSNSGSSLNSPQAKEVVLNALQAAGKGAGLKVCPASCHLKASQSDCWDVAAYAVDMNHSACVARCMPRAINAGPGDALSPVALAAKLPWLLYSSPQQRHSGCEPLHWATVSGTTIESAHVPRLRCCCYQAGCAYTA